MTLPVKAHFIITTPEGERKSLYTLSDLSLSTRRGINYEAYIDKGPGEEDARLIDALGAFIAVEIKGAIEALAADPGMSAAISKRGYRVAHAPDPDSAPFTPIIYRMRGANGRTINVAAGHVSHYQGLAIRCACPQPSLAPAAHTAYLNWRAALRSLTIMQARLMEADPALDVEFAEALALYHTLYASDSDNLLGATRHRFSVWLMGEKGIPKMRRELAARLLAEPNHNL